MGCDNRGVSQQTEHLARVKCNCGWVEATSLSLSQCSQSKPNGVQKKLQICDTFGPNNYFYLGCWVGGGCVLNSMPNSDIWACQWIQCWLPSLSSAADRCAGGECDVEEENLRGNSVRLHQTRLGSSKVTFTIYFLSLPLSSTVDRLLGSRPSRKGHCAPSAKFCWSTYSVGE